MALPGKVQKKVKFAEDNLCGDEPALTTASLKPPGTWSISKEELLSARNTRSRSPRRSSKTTELLQSPLKTVGQSRLLRLARMGRQQAAKLRDKSNIAALQASVAAGPKVIVVEKVVEVVKIIEALTLTNSNQVEVIDIDIVDKIDEHPKFKKSRLSLEDENKLYSKCEQMNHDYKVLADKLERLDAENHNLLKANKELNENKDMMMEMMKDVMAEKIKALMEENRTNMRENVKEAVMTAANTVKEKMDEDYAVILAEKDTKFMQTIKEMEAKADVDKTKIQKLESRMRQHEKKIADLEDQNLDLQFRLEDKEKLLQRGKTKQKERKG